MRIVNTIRGGLRGAWLAIRARPVLFVTVVLAVLLLDFFLPLLVLAVARKPWDYFQISSAARQLPQWAISPGISVGRKVGFLSNLGLFWLAGLSPYHTVAWVFEVRTRDLVRWVSMALLAGAYFASWLCARTWGVGRAAGWSRNGSRGLIGTLLCAVGLFASPCSVGGYDAPVLPVIGLASHGLTSFTLTTLAVFSAGGTIGAFVGLSLGVLALGRVVSRT